MQMTRRQFVGQSAVSVAAAPLLLGGSIDYCEAATADGVDWSMGFPDGAVLLNRNENPVGPSARAIEAAREGVGRSLRYADPAYLRALLADHHDVDREWILVGQGSGELLSLSALVFAREGNVVSPLQGYRALANYAEKIGSTINWVELLADRNYAYDIDGMLSAVDAGTRLMFTVTPNNPTGTLLSYESMRKLADNLPSNVLLVIDEAYVHFQEPGSTGIDLLKEGYDNVLVTRTFSKAYALAGLRSGYGLGHPDIMRRIGQLGCGPTSTNMAGFGAVAASIGDDDQIQRSRRYISDTRSFYQTKFEALGLKYVSGPPNFIMVDLGDKAKSVATELRNRNIFVRYGDEWAMPNHVRISYGQPSENERFFEALRELV